MFIGLVEEAWLVSCCEVGCSFVLYLVRESTRPPHSRAKYYEGRIFEDRTVADFVTLMLIDVLLGRAKCEYISSYSYAGPIIVGS